MSKISQPDSLADTLAPDLRKEADLRELSRLTAKWFDGDRLEYTVAVDTGIEAAFEARGKLGPR